MPRRKFSAQFERDYQFYLSNIKNFTFAGSNVKDGFDIQYPEELSKTRIENGITVDVSFSIPYSEQGKNAKTCFWILDSQGKKVPCSEPKLLVDLLTCKAAINLQIKIWAQSRAEMTLSKIELQEYLDHYQAPEWVFMAIENQKKKIIKQWIDDKVYKNDGYYRYILAFHMSEILNEMKVD